MASLFYRGFDSTMGRDHLARQQPSRCESTGIGQGMAKHEQMFQKPCQQALKPTRPGPSPPPRIAKGLDASVQMARCCQEIVFKRAPAPCLNTPKAVALLVKRDI
ncbi:hypothetical protein CQ006_12655 [Pseudomonas cedrina]|uniref:Uncharacterized protein n=1 Tax=Pseudomonas cedrina TaxID=651740 RepID=A0A2S9DRG1_PSECE|nr:hypothetical protein CLM72_06080 [Pseudomonas sp. MYb193]PRC05159.1 hypothetical protein CQ006_12655 [Pseudomonas cedrina]